MSKLDQCPTCGLFKVNCECLVVHFHVPGRGWNVLCQFYRPHEAVTRNRGDVTCDECLDSMEPVP